MKSYARKYLPNHPSATAQGHVPVHILAAEKALGRQLPAGAHVHHVDGNHLNNANSNLVICQDAAYHKLLHVRTRIVRAGGNPNTEKICSVCGAVKRLDSFNRSSSHSTGRQNICRECSKAAFAEWERARKGAA